MYDTVVQVTVTKRFLQEMSMELVEEGELKI